MNLAIRMKRLRNQVTSSLKDAGRQIKKDVKKDIEFKQKLKVIKKDSYNKERIRQARKSGREKAQGSILKNTKQLYNEEKKENKINQIPPMFR